MLTPCRISRLFSFRSLLLVCGAGALAAGTSACFGSAAGTIPDNPPQSDDGGADDASGSNPYDTPVTCTSNTHWTRGTRGSASMQPGGTCIGCHATTGGEAPTFVVAGTVYPSAHEPNDCNGSANASVVITDSTGKSLTLTTNAAGNFYASAGALTPPYHAKVVANGKERAMSAAQTTGDCNSCHTESGAHDAPGRIMLP